MKNLSEVVQFYGTYYKYLEIFRIKKVAVKPEIID